MADLRRGIPDRLTSPYRAAGAAQIFPLAAVGKLILAGSGGGTVPPWGRAAGFAIFRSSLPSLLRFSIGPHSFSGVRVLLLQARSLLPLSTVVLLCPLPGSQAESLHSRERCGLGEDWAGSAAVRWAQDRASPALMSG